MYVSGSYSVCVIVDDFVTRACQSSAMSSIDYDLTCYLLLRSQLRFQRFRVLPNTWTLLLPVACLITTNTSSIESRQAEPALTPAYFFSIFQALPLSVCKYVMLQALDEFLKPGDLLKWATSDLKLSLRFGWCMFMLPWCTLSLVEGSEEHLFLECHVVAAAVWILWLSVTSRARWNISTDRKDLTYVLCCVYQGKVSPVGLGPSVVSFKCSRKCRNFTVRASNKGTSESDDKNPSDGILFSIVVLKFKHYIYAAS